MPAPAPAPALAASSDATAALRAQLRGSVPWLLISLTFAAWLAASCAWG
jgi:hypothetical protein